MTPRPVPRPSPPSREGADRLRGNIPLPTNAPRLRVGLFGGSFNPPHAAHRAASLFAMKRLGLDRVWWLVTPGNPLKDINHLPPLADRLAAARALARHPRIDVSDLEVRFGARYSVDTLRALRQRYPLVRFVWLMGVDNLVNFHRWKDWRALATLVPIAVIDRGLVGLRAFGARAPQALARYRVPEHAAQRLAGRRPPAWVFLHGIRSAISSTELRKKRASVRRA
jgi:nicotinate-nucleotide adenylyltransferase